MDQVIGFVAANPTSLVGQLFLTNRILFPQSQQILTAAPDEYHEILSILDRVASGTLDVVDMRKAALLFASGADVSNDPVAVYSGGIQIIQAIDSHADARLSFTKEYILRVFEKRMKEHEDIVNRDINPIRQEH